MEEVERRLNEMRRELAPRDSEKHRGDPNVTPPPPPPRTVQRGGAANMTRKSLDDATTIYLLPDSTSHPYQRSPSPRNDRPH